MSYQNYPYTSVKTLRNSLVTLIGALLLAACAAPVHKNNSSKNLPINPFTPEGQRQLRLQKLVKSNVAQIIVNNALANHDAVAYVKAALAALHSSYSLDLAQLDRQLHPDNAYSIFYNAMGIAYRKKMDVSAEEIDKTAIGAMLKLVDASSKFYYAEDFTRLRKGMGKRGVIGVKIDQDAQGLVLVDVMTGGEAARAQVPLYSHIIAIDKMNVQNRSVVDVVTLLRGKPGSAVDLTVKRPDGSVHTYQLRRSILKLHYVTLRKLKHQVLYIRLTGFTHNMDKTIMSDYGKLGFHAGSVILDLRNNSGGNMNSVSKVADLFLPSGKLFSIKNRNPLFDVEFKTKTGDPLEQLRPIAVLVSASTGSAAEALVTALRAKAKARIIGSRTKGSAVIHSIFRLHDGTAMNLTTGMLVSADGQSWQDKGIQPDICLNFEKNLVIKTGAQACRKSYFNHATPMNRDSGVQQALLEVISRR